MDMEELKHSLQKNHTRVASYEEILKALRVSISEIQESKDFKRLRYSEIIETHTERFILKEPHLFEGEYESQVEQYLEYIKQRKEEIKTYLESKNIKEILSYKVGKPTLRHGMLDVEYKRPIPEEKSFILFLNNEFAGSNDMLFTMVDDMISFYLFGLCLNYKPSSNLDMNYLKEKLESADKIEDVLHQIIKHENLIKRV